MTAAPLAHDAGAQHERRLAARGLRKVQGSYYTPPDVVDGLLELSLGPLLAERSARPDAPAQAVAELRVLDPACGSGNVLVAAAERIAAALVALGVPADEAAAHAFGRAVVGVDLDPEAVRLCRAALRSASGGRATVADTTRQVRRADALLLAARGPAPSWERLERSVGAGGGFHLVVGNPPFLNQLEAGTAHARDHARALRERFGAAAAGYTDPAALFLLLAHERARPAGGVVALIEPLPLLSARDAGAVRSAVLADARLHALWVAGERIFDAAVQVCAPVLVRGPAAAAAAPTTTALVRGRAFEPCGQALAPTPADGSWSGLLATVQGVPDPVLATAGTLADLASATADFRDQYYGLAAHVVEAELDPDGHHPPLVTAGLIDPADNRWGRTATTFNKVSYRFPRVAVADLAEPLRAWAARRLVPKVLVATQTRVLEAVVDRDGAWLPSVPVISVVAPAADLWRIAALLSSPPITAVAARRHLGAGLHGEALKLRAKEVLALPLPAHRAAWDRAAAHVEAAATATDPAVRRHHLLASARCTLAAYGCPDDDRLLAWWSARLPKPPVETPRS